ncbi:hypothetical protein BCR33DRAFT_353027 [Rhizoclosmatium globosum]|uniref:Ataxin-10 homolog n=1 Tax=Rhizoclosmatium globosum TaxID=329046 RepID=A0A1Y2C253_9FUNG|nr:hypothetical protein BCR33DRAFT_353027 [Rhizoclosmatium globosum]|eukprot:ORY41091.1 hypothetical protein BCR33DRAFT_353027 [Rhizoclosmatium globosum]
MSSDLSEYEVENEALRLCAQLEGLSMSAAATTDSPAKWVDSAPLFREAARAVCNNLVLRRKLGIIPAFFPLVARLLVTLKTAIQSVYTAEPTNEYGDDFGRCGYTSWKSANGATELTTAVFHLIRNLVAAVPENQILACQSGCYKTLDEILSHFSLWLQRNKTNSCPDIKVIACKSVQMGMQCLANIMTSNPIVQNKVWPRFFGESELFLILFETNDCKTVNYVLLCIYNCIYNDPQRSSFLLQTPLGRKILHKILLLIDTPTNQTTSPSEEDDHFEIVYAIFKTLTTSLPPAHTFKSQCLLNKDTPSETAPIHLNSLNRAHLVFLKLADGNMAENSGTSLWGDGYAKTTIKLMEVLVTSLQRFHDAIVAAGSASGIDAIGSDVEAIMLILTYFGRITGGDDASVEAAVVAAREAGVFVSGPEEAMWRRRKMFVELGLVEPVVKFLVVAGKIQPPVAGGIAKSNGMGGPKIMEVDERVEEVLDVVRKGLYMLKGAAIKVLSNLSYKCKEGQDEVRRTGGIPVILNHCHIDDAQPFVKEYAVFAIRNLCEGNLENQKLIESMEVIGLPEGQNEGLAAHGVRAGLSDDGRVRISPVDF